MPDTTTDLRELLARVEAAEGPGYALDVAIAKLFYPDYGSPGQPPIPPLTASIDAALAFKERLLPHHTIRQATQATTSVNHPPFGRWGLCIQACDGRSYMGADGVPVSEFWARQKPLPLAIIIATLKAYIAQQEAENGD